MTITKQPEAVEEVIGGAVSHMMKRYPEYEIMVSIPEDVLIVPMDAKLIEQVLINLFDNAVKHSTLDCEIGISVREERNMAVFSITDHGNGIALSDLPNIFQMFYTTASGEADARRGVGWD
jgi:two-component system sensor histidine kinase KdpD